MRVSLAAVLEEDLAGGLRRVDTHAICHRSGEGSGEAMQRRKRSGEAGHGEPGEACAPFVMIALVDSFCLNCEAGACGRSVSTALRRLASPDSGSGAVADSLLRHAAPPQQRT